MNENQIQLTLDAFNRFNSSFEDDPTDPTLAYQLDDCHTIFADDDTLILDIYDECHIRLISIFYRDELRSLTIFADTYTTHLPMLAAPDCDTSTFFLDT